jgi:hypothetical protein
MDRAAAWERLEKMKEEELQAKLGSCKVELQGRLIGLRQALQEVRTQDSTDPFQPTPGGANDFSESDAGQWQPVLQADHSRRLQREWRTARAKSVQTVARLVEDRYLPGLQAAAQNRLAWLELFLKTWKDPLETIYKKITG